MLKGSASGNDHVCVNDKAIASRSLKQTWAAQERRQSAYIALVQVMCSLHPVAQLLHNHACSIA